MKTNQKTKVFFFIFFGFLFVCNTSMAQTPGSYQQSTVPYANQNVVQQGKNDFLVVMAAGAAGAVLGLSTLSFVDQPKEHWDNVLTGGALGIIAGVLYVAYRQANVPGTFEEQPHQIQTPDERTYTFQYNSLRDQWSNAIISKNSENNALSFQLTKSF
ncbi:MAG: hypothetical protein H6621_02765 [Halobacteriovoraceae bacterium]|nr:hypothetical protein [Halobacteriovoraceae bacterium]MCB9093966.1 hypothetical protein [Halobacteriovoraceae bacterium]